MVLPVSIPDVRNGAQLLRRRAGVLMHPTSLPGPVASGDIGPDAVRFLDWMAEAGLGVWQVLPLVPVGSGDSPYDGLSAFAGDPMLISPRALLTAGWLPRGRLDEIEPGEPSQERVEFEPMRRWKWALLRESWQLFERSASACARRQLTAFCEHSDQRGWLENWALYAALRNRMAGEPWFRWDSALRGREASSLAAARKELREEIAFQRYLQFLFFRQWGALKAAARARAISVIGDMPYYVAHDSAEVWAAPELFQLDERGLARNKGGVPPDYFSSDGQLWGNPVYDWPRHQESGYAWWIRRIEANLRLFDRLRLDHFRGFAAYWSVPGEESTAIHGSWVPGPGRSLIESIAASLHRLPLLAEDLGLIDDDVLALRDAFGLPGMRILQFEIGRPPGEDANPVDCENQVVYTGTHDNDTILGWFGKLDPDHQARVRDQLKATAAEVGRRMIETAFEATARLAVVPAQDLLGLGTVARMNTPGESRGNWSWRARRGAFTLELASRLRELSGQTRRLRAPSVTI